MGIQHYFDHAASSPMTPACAQAFAAYDASPWAGANPNSLHGAGRKAFEALEQSRASVARALGARRPAEVLFVSGGTEANNLAVQGMARAVCRTSHGARSRILVSALDHDSVIDPARRVAAVNNMTVELIPATREGVVDLQALAQMLAGDVALVSVMAANNEVGTVQPIAEVVRMAHEVGALVHTDAVQAFGHIPFSASALGVDAVSIAAHKLGGPVGIGALYLKARTPLDPWQVGGGQEGGLRSGTPDVRAAMACAAVALDAVEHLEERTAQVRLLANALVNSCCAGPDACAVPTVDAPRDERFLPGIVHLLVPGHQTEGLVLGLDERGYEVAGGSACSSGSLEPSHVLTAMGVPRDQAFCALRLSVDHRTPQEACEGLGRALHELCACDALRRHRDR